MAPQTVTPLPAEQKRLLNQMVRKVLDLKPDATDFEYVSKTRVSFELNGIPMIAEFEDGHYARDWIACQQA